MILKLPSFPCLFSSYLLVFLGNVYASVASPSSLNTFLCTNYCQSGCQQYRTPFHRCYNPQTLFPLDSSWAHLDMFDMVLNEVEFMRSFFGTNNETCSGDPTDTFRLQIDECVGPFGKPRPWGNFSFIDDASPNEES